MIDFLKLFFWKKKKEEIEKPHHYLEIVYSKEAMEKGILDEYQKKIVRWKGGKIVQRVDYTSHDFIAMKKIYNIPHIDMTNTDDEEFQFSQLPALHGELVETFKE